MTPEAQRIAIAEACGLKPPFFYDPKGKWQVKTRKWTIPDYLNDLNAMHEAEKVLKLEQHPRYFENLHALNDWEWMATASQRAETFLRTLGLWKAT